MKKKDTEKNLSEIANIFRILSEPTRLEILQFLENSESSVTDIVRALNCKQPNVSKHLAILTFAKLIQKRKQGTTVLYSISDPFIFKLCEVVCNSNLYGKYKD